MSTHKSRFWVIGYLSAASAAMIVLTWVAELTDLQRYLLGGKPHGFDWRTAALETWFILAVWAASMLLMKRLVAHLVYLEGFLRICAWCRKVGYQEKWLPLEQYFALGFDVKTTHGICPDCLKKAEEDTTRFFKRNASHAQSNTKLKD